MLNDMLAIVLNVNYFPVAWTLTALTLLSICAHIVYKASLKRMRAEENRRFEKADAIFRSQEETFNTRGLDPCLAPPWIRKEEDNVKTFANLSTLLSLATIALWILAFVAG